MQHQQQTYYEKIGTMQHLYTHIYPTFPISRHSERWNKAIWALSHPTTPAWFPVGSKRRLQSSHLTLEWCRRRSLHFFSYDEFSGCFLGEIILDDVIVGWLERDVLNNSLSLGS